MVQSSYILPRNTSGERLVYIRRDGIVYPLHAPPWRAVLQQEGFGTPPLDYVTDRSPFQHGDTVRSFTAGPRAVQLVVLHNFCSRAEYWTGRQAFLNLLRPGMAGDPVMGGKLLYYLAGKKKRALDVLLESGPGFTPTEGWQEWSFTEAIRFVAHEPSWYDPDMHAQTLLYGTPSNELIFPADFPIWFDQSQDIVQNQVIYRGTWISYPIIEVYGPVTGFRLENLVTGDQIGLSQAVPDGYMVTFDLPGYKTVYGSDNANWLPFVTPDSDLATFCLMTAPGADQGVNQMSLSGTGTSPQSRVVIKYYDRFFGI